MTQKINQETVFAALSEIPKSASEIAKEIGVYRGTPKRYLDGLVSAGKAKKVDDGWIRIEMDVVQLVVQQDVADVAQRNTTTDIVKIIKEAAGREDNFSWLSDTIAEKVVDEVITKDQLNEFLSGSIVSDFECYMCASIIDLATSPAYDIESVKDYVVEIEVQAKAIAYIRAFRDSFLRDLPKGYFSSLEEKK